MFMLTFTAPAISGSSRGKLMGTPTINLDLAHVPAALREGIYVCRVIFDEDDKADMRDAVMHFGPRPVFKDKPSCEIHVIDERIDEPPMLVHVDVIERLRDVLDFPSPDDLKVQIEEDIRRAKEMLKR